MLMLTDTNAILGHNRRTVKFNGSAKMYGVLMKARSKAVLTFLVQLSCQYSGYLPTERAAKGGGYSADNYLVGPEGGYKLVDETVRRINEMWEN